jgi:hypothetical protein
MGSRLSIPLLVSLSFLDPVLQVIEIIFLDERRLSVLALGTLDRNGFLIACL